jgi:predicted RNase H-like nuclease (RuvC/YqgF family)
MTKLIISLFAIVMLFLYQVHAEEKSPGEQLEEIRIMIEREQIRNIELKAELAKKEQEAEELKLKLQQIENEINDLKAKHNLN